MFCNNCGRVIEGDAKFCGKCGAKVEKSKFDNNIEEVELQVDSNNNEEFINQNCNEKTERSAKKEAIASVVIPAIAIFVYTFIGLSIFLAVFIAGIGFECAKGGKKYSKKLSTTGYVLNGILCAMAVIMYIAIRMEGK